MAAILSMQEVREIEAALHVEILPGTEVMTQGTYHFPCETVGIDD